MKTPFIAFSPVSGVPAPLPLSITIEEAHRRWDAAWGAVWQFNPWTGKPRDPRDVESDPYGQLLVYSTKDMRAAERTCACFPGTCRQEVIDGYTAMGERCKRVEDGKERIAGMRQDHVRAAEVAGGLTFNEASGEDIGFGQTSEDIARELLDMAAGLTRLARTISRLR